MLWIASRWRDPIALAFAVKGASGMDSWVVSDVDRAGFGTAYICCRERQRAASIKHSLVTADGREIVVSEAVGVGLDLHLLPASQRPHICSAKMRQASILRGNSAFAHRVSVAGRATPAKSKLISSPSGTLLRCRE
ncbi:hypothetical protein D3C71_1041190 [compost metagenome]